MNINKRLDAVAEEVTKKGDGSFVFLYSLDGNLYDKCPFTGEPKPLTKKQERELKGAFENVVTICYEDGLGDLVA